MTMKCLPRSCVVVAVAAVVVPFAAHGHTVAAANAPVTEYALPSYFGPPYGVAAGPDGSVWYADSGGAIGKVTPTGAVTTYPIPTDPTDPRSGLASAPRDITAGPDGAMWFTEWQGNKIARISVAGVITEYPVPGPLCGEPPQYASRYPTDIVTGPDGALWFTDQCNDQSIGRMTTNGTFTFFKMPVAISASQFLYSFSITRGTGGVWFTAIGSPQSYAGRVTINGIFTMFPLPRNDFGSQPIDGPDGNIWFFDNYGLVRLAPRGTMTHFDGLPPGCGGGLTSGSDGNLWFTDDCGNSAIGRVTLGAAISFTEYPTPTSGSFPYYITAGPSSDIQSIWFSEVAGPGLGRVDLKQFDANAVTAVAKNLTMVEGQTTSRELATFADLDGNSDPTAYSIVVDWGDGNQSYPTAIKTGNDFKVVASHLYAEEGTYPLNVTVTDADGYIAYATTTTVRVTDAPMTAQGVAGTFSGSNFNGTLATFTDANPANDISDFTASISWGDGTTSAGTVSGGGPFSVAGSHSYTKVKTYQVVVTIKDVGGSAAAASTRIMKS